MSSLWMFPALIAVILTGFPVALTMMALAVVFGLHSFGLVGLQYQFIQKLEEVATAQVLAAVPLFIFMGAMFEPRASPRACSMRSTCGRGACLAAWRSARSSCA